MDKKNKPILIYTITTPVRIIHNIEIHRIDKYTELTKHNTENWLSTMHGTEKSFSELPKKEVQ